MLKHFKIVFIHSKHNYNVEIYRCTCAERSQHFFDLNIRRRFFFYWTQRVLSLFPPFVGVLGFCEQKATLMTIHKMQKWKMISLVFFYSFNCNMISEMNGWHIVLWTLGISSIFCLSLKMRLCDDWKNESDKQQQQQDNCSPFIRLLIITFGRWLNRPSGFMKSLNSLKDSRLILLFLTHVSFWKLNHRLKTNEQNQRKTVKFYLRSAEIICWEQTTVTERHFF